jgi:hypothetical protein
MKDYIILIIKKLLWPPNTDDSLIDCVELIAPQCGALRLPSAAETKSIGRPAYAHIAAHPANRTMLTLQLKYAGRAAILPLANFVDAPSL